MEKLNLDSLLKTLGEIDVYFLDQIMRGHLREGMTVLDAGCGGGRNSALLMAAGFKVYGVDESSRAIAAMQQIAEHSGGENKPDQFRRESIENLSFENETFDFVLCNAVLHFCKTEDQFLKMVQQMYRVLKPGGIFFARLMSTIGIEDRITQQNGRVYRLPTGSINFLVDEEFLIRVTEELGAELIDPIKTVNVQNQRCMTNWCFRKR